MNFQPVIPGGGLVGWRFLQQTYDAQFETFNKSLQLDRDSEYFIQNINEIRTAEELVSDRRLLGVALGAFGLQEDLNNRYFVQKILEEGASSEDALANRLPDERYRQLSEAFGFGPGAAIATGDAAGMAEIAQKNRVQAFEIAVGEQNDNMRIALYGERELDALARAAISEDAKWYSLMGMPPLRSMFETALNLPSAFAGIDIDKQMEVFRDKIRSVMGDASVAQFADPEARDRLTSLFLVRAQITEMNAISSSAANALALLQAAGI